jgi:hypothetical protein
VYASMAVLSALKATIELELSTTIDRDGFTISVESLLIMGFISSKRTQKMDTKRKKAKNKISFDLFLTL